MSATLQAGCKEERRDSLFLANRRLFVHLKPSPFSSRRPRQLPINLHRRRSLPLDRFRVDLHRRSRHRRELGRRRCRWLREESLRRQGHGRTSDESLLGLGLDEREAGERGEGCKISFRAVRCRRKGVEEGVLDWTGSPAPAPPPHPSSCPCQRPSPANSTVRPPAPPPFSPPDWA